MNEDPCPIRYLATRLFDTLFSILAIVPQSIRFCHHIKLNYVSCSAPRIPIARLAAAHAKLLEKDYVFEAQK